MAYNPYFPTGYQPLYVPQYQQPPQVPQVQPMPQAQTAPQVQQGNNGLIWVQGIEAAKSYLVAPNTTIMLMDSEARQFYIKSADASGMPLPLRVFKFEEVLKQPEKEEKAPEPIDMSNYVEKRDYEAFKRHIEGLLQSSAEQNRKEERKTR